MCVKMSVTFTQRRLEDVAPAASPAPAKTKGETVISNGLAGSPRLSICVPTWKDNAGPLLDGLIPLVGADQCALIIFDDGSNDPDLTTRLTEQVMRFPGPAQLIIATENGGRSAARNRLFQAATSDWILFLDADMQPDDGSFLMRYLNAVDRQDGPGLIVGGFSLRHAQATARTRLHAAQSLASECVPAAIRAREPGRYVFSSNLLVHRTVLNDIEFDPAFKGWGWEDVDWGLRVAASYPIEHIENCATHLGLDTDAALIEKYKKSADNFALLMQRHPDEMGRTALYRSALGLSRIWGRSLFIPIFRGMAKARLLPMRLRLLSLKLYRASIYGARL